jgi:hypothetical protein
MELLFAGSVFLGLHGIHVLFAGFFVSWGFPVLGLKQPCNSTDTEQRKVDLIKSVCSVETKQTVFQTESFH